MTRDEKAAALAIRYRDGEFSETVYRASLFAIGYRGDAITAIMQEQQHHGQTDRINQSRGI